MKKICIIYDLSFLKDNLKICITNFSMNYTSLNLNKRIYKIYKNVNYILYNLTNVQKIFVKFFSLLREEYLIKKIILVGKTKPRMTSRFVSEQI